MVPQKWIIGFEPLSYLGIKVGEEEKDIISARILELFSQYLLIRLAELLSVQELERVYSIEQLLTMAKGKEPNLEEKIKKYMEDFRKDFTKKYGY